MTRQRIGLADLDRILADADRLESFEESSPHRRARVTPMQILSFLEVVTGDAFDVSPEAAIAYFRNKGLQPSFSWADMIGEAHDQAFTVAKMMDIDLLKRVRDSLDTAMATGQNFRDWANGLAPDLQRSGWWGSKSLIDPVTGLELEAQLGSPWRLDTIFRTNMQTAYSVGQWQEIIEQAEIAPYLMYDAVDDSRTREQHRSWDMLVLPVNHPWWRTHFPPNGFNCRCSVIQMTYDEARDLGLSVTQDAPDDGFYVWANPRTGEVIRIPNGIDPGFDRNPGRAMLADIDRIMREKIQALPTDMQPFAERAVKLPFDANTRAGRWHNAGFDQAPSWIRNAVLFSQQVDVQQTPNSTAYALRDRFVDMDGYTMDDLRGQSVWRHEFGHIIDARLGYLVGRPYRSADDDFVRLQDSDAKYLFERAGVPVGRDSARKRRRRDELTSKYRDTAQRIIIAPADQREAVLRSIAAETSIDFDQFIGLIRDSTYILDGAEIGNIGTAVRIAKMMEAIREGDVQEFTVLASYKDMDDMRALTGRSWRKDGALASLSDLVGATTNNRLMSYNESFPGHSPNYYRQGGRSFNTTEAWANLMALAGHPNPYWWELVQRLLPGQAALFRRILEEQE